MMAGLWLYCSFIVDQGFRNFITLTSRPGSIYIGQHFPVSLLGYVAMMLLPYRRPGSQPQEVHQKQENK